MYSFPEFWYSMQKDSLVNVTSIIFKYTRIQTKNKNWKKNNVTSGMIKKICGVWANS